MKKDTLGSASPDIKTAAVCGLFCKACTIYIGSMEDRVRLEKLAARFGGPAADWECHGCRSDTRTAYCEHQCTMTKCAAAKGVEFCGLCPDYPCEELKAFQAQAPHRIELWQSHQRIKEAGWETWYTEMEQHYSCKKCGTVNSAYDVSCRKCGAEPGSRFVELHRAEVEKHLGKTGT